MASDVAYRLIDFHPKRPTKRTMRRSARRSSALVGEAPASTSECESGPPFEGCRAARGSVSDLRVLGRPGAPELGSAGRASHPECPPSKAECLTVCERGLRVLGQVSHVRSLI